MTMPSRFHIVSLNVVPFPTNPDCWPLSLPPTLTRSTMTPGTVLSAAHGSFDCGVPSSSAVVSVVDVPDFLTSTTGDAPVTTTVSASPPTANVNGIWTFTPVLTMTSRACFVNPGSSTVTVYVALSRLRNRNCPPVSVTVVRGAPPIDFATTETVAPGRTPPCESETVP